MSSIYVKPTKFQTPFPHEADQLEILLDNIDSRRHIALHKRNGNIVFTPLYTNQDSTISGKIQTNLKRTEGKQAYCAKIELIGKIEFFNVGKKGFNFVTMEKRFGPLVDPNASINFKFENFPKKYETYTGQLVETQYVLQATIIKADEQEIKKEQEFALYILSPIPENLNVFTIQIGVMEAVEVDLEYKKTNYHVEECIIGRILVNVAQVEIKKMELYLIKVENYFHGSKSKIKEEVLKRIMLKEGQPRKGEMIPLKLPLASLNLCPTMQNVENRFNIKYYLTLGLIDSNERMFFRKVEITLRRAMEK